jgi:RNA polymerase sigma-70 factor (family 1)
MQDYHDTGLVEMIASGSKDAFEEIYHRYHRQLYHLAIKYLKSKDLAEDAVQDVFVTLWQKKERLSPIKSVQAFLYTCLKNHILNMIRNHKKKMLSEIELLDEDYVAPNSTWEEINFADCMQIVNEGLLELSDRKRKVFELKVFEGLSNSEIAEKLHISVNTVKVHYYQSSQFIKAYLNKHTGKGKL